jgi:hypothetical protein
MDAANRRARYKKIGMAVLVAGIVGALVLYFVRIHMAESADSTMAQYDNSTERAENQQMGRLYGKSGQQMEGLIDDLKYPGPQSVIIGLVAFIIAMGFFTAARPLPEDEEKS